MKNFALWCARWRVGVLVAWVVVLVGLAGAVVGAGSAFTDSTTLPNSESSTAYGLLAQKSGSTVETTTGNIVWHTTGTSINSAELRTTTTQMLSQVATMPGVEAVVTPYTSAGQGQLDTKTNTAYASVTMLKGANTDAVAAVAEKMQTSVIDVQVGGAAFTTQPGGGATEGLGIIIAFLILLLVFRSIWGAVLPIITGVVGVGVSLLAVMLGSHLVDLASTSLTMGALIGLGVGIDYSLFVVNRFRKAAVAGVPTPQAIAIALNTSGRAVIFAGLTVIVALAGMIVVNIGILTGMAMVAAFTVLITMAAAVTLLPALLAILGHKVLSKKQRSALKTGSVVITSTKPAKAATWAALLQRAPRRMAGAALLLILLLAAPVLSMRVGDSDASSDPTGSVTRIYYDEMAAAFGDGFDAPLVVVGSTPDTASAKAFTALVNDLAAVNGVAHVAAAPAVAGQTIAVATVVPTTSAQAKETTDLVNTLRDSVIPTAEVGTDLHVYVGGTTATSIDLSHAVSSKLLLYLALIAVLGFLLLAIAFRSILVPLVGAVSNLATIFVGLGAVTAIFQFGWGSELLGVGSGAPVMYLIPTLVVGIMFGLSMDYQVFLVSRVHEEWSRTGDNGRAVKVGVSETATVIAAAALIMLSVFASFGFSGERIVSEIGIGMAVGVVIDAFVVRMTLIPAIMNLLGRRNWAYPRWADRITPRLSIEGDAEEANYPSDQVLAAAGSTAGARSAEPSNAR